MEFDLFGERRSSHWVRSGESAKRNFWLDSAHENRKPDPGLVFCDSQRGHAPPCTVASENILPERRVSIIGKQSVPGAVATGSVSTGSDSDRVIYEALIEVKGF